MNTEQIIISAWREGLAEAAQRPAARKQLLQRECELLPSFAAHYEKLKAQPRRMRRALQRQWKRSLAGIAMLLVLGQAPALAATINVGGNCTLGRAITSANNDTAVGGCARGRGADRIVLPRNSTQTLTAVNNTNFGPTGLPVVRSVITIDGNGSTIRRAPSAPNFRIFAVGYGGGDLRLQEITVSGGASPGNGGGLVSFGTLTLANSSISGNQARGNGGGVSSSYNAGALTVTNSTISGNTAAGSGGGISSTGSTGPRIANSAISGNTARSSGGGVHNYSREPLMLTDSTISGNLSGNGGGGVYNQSSLTVTSSTISSNTAVYGGGIFNPNQSAAECTVTNSTISGNSTTGEAGNGGGGGIVNGGLLTVTNSTISGNSATGGGGGVEIFYGSVTLNRALISGNTASSGQEIRNQRYSPAVVTAADFNVFGHQGLTNAQAFANFTPGLTDITATSNGNDPTPLAAVLNTNLANNGGPTRTHALPAGSPAVDSVIAGTCPPPARDQRGVQRPQDGNGDGGAACDTGSYERR